LCAKHGVEAISQPTQYQLTWIYIMHSPSFGTKAVSYLLGFCILPKTQGIMSSVQIKSSVTVEDLLEGVAQLEEEELEAFIQKVIRLKAQKVGGSISQRESELIAIISEGPTQDWLKRLRDLDEKRLEGKLDEAELEEYQGMAEEVERKSVNRLEAIKELAALRNTGVSEIMNQLCIDG